MNYMEILDDLRQERDLVDHAIAVLERMQVGAPRRRGRPPGWLTDRKNEVTGGGGGSASGDATPGPEPVKRKRGRPRKNQPMAVS
ncbi:MAG TPA: hypothetical protein VGL53_18210 [Bryobacteraceae bacterium]